MDSRVSKPAALLALMPTGGTAPACIQCSSGSSLKMAPRSQGMPGAPASLRNTQKKISPGTQRAEKYSECLVSHQSHVICHTLTAEML